MGVKIEIPELCVVAMVGASGSGKSTFAQKHFRATEILSSDWFRGMVSDDENDQGATQAAFESLYFVAEKRLDNGKLAVIDATNVQDRARKKILDFARAQNVFAAAIVLDMDGALCLERNRQRPGRSVPAQVLRSQVRDLGRSIHRLQKEGFRYVYILHGPEEAENAEIVRTKLWNDRREERGPFDIIGDIHGCYDELAELLEKLGYTVDRGAFTALPPEGRRAVFLGDLCDRGPANAAVLRLVMNMCESTGAVCVPGNHDAKLLRVLRGTPAGGASGGEIKLTHGLDRTVAELEKEKPEFTGKVIRFLDGLVSHYVLDGGRLVVAHAGIKEKFQGRSSGTVRAFCLYGDTTGETDEFGLPVRLDWAEEYRGRAFVVYGHVPSREVYRSGNTIRIDTGCVFGGKLSAYRYPEGEIAEVPARREYYAPVKPLDYDARGGAAEPAGPEPDIQDLLGLRRVETRFHRDIPVAEENAALALEIMSRFAAPPRWLVYLPPTMSPCETHQEGPFLEHPAEAFGWYRKRGVTKVVCEEKHMGSRAVIVLCRDGETAEKRFGVEDGSAGIIYTRTGRRFFEGAEAAHETALLSRLRTALDASNFWKDFSTDWLCLDTELMPWSAKARSLILEQYAPAGLAGRLGLAAAVEALEAARGRARAAPATASLSPDVPAGTPGSLDLDAAAGTYRGRLEFLERYTDAYRRYCWTVSSVDDFRIAPFHVLATEGRVWHDENHLRHLEVIKNYIAGSDPVFLATRHLPVTLDDENSVAAGTAWWLDLTEAGGEGMVVKPLDFIVRNAGGLLQPAVKCRGREYLRIIYGPEYSAPERLERLRKRSLRKKQNLALAEFALGMEALERFAGGEPFHRVHECIFALLALENETVDPRL